MKKISILLCVCLLLSGCTTTKYRAIPGFEQYFSGVKTIAIMPPDIKISKLTAGGVTELMDEWTAEAKSKILYAIREELSPSYSFNSNLVDVEKLPESDKDFIREQTGLYNSVAASIVWHTYAPDSIFQHKINNFDYTLGPDISRLSTLAECDTLLFCSGRNYIWTAGRTGMAFFGALLGCATGVLILPTSEAEYIAISFVDVKSGDVVWFDCNTMQGDLRKDTVCQKNMRSLFSSLPERSNDVN